MANQRIDQLNAETNPAAADLLPVFSIAGADTKKITVKNLVQVGATLIDDASIPSSKVNLAALNIVNANIDANAEISVSKLADGSARQLLQTDAAGTGVEWASNIDIPGTLDVTNAAIFDSTVAVTGALTKSGSNVVTVGDTGTVTSTMLLDATIVNADINASAAIVDTKLATIATAGKVSNSSTTATSANTASAIVARDASGNFTAGTITAALTGNASTVTTNANLTGHITSVGNAAVLGSFTSAQLAAALTDETGTGANVFATSPTLVTPVLGTPSSGTLTNCTFPTLNQNTTGNAATVTTNANLTGHITSVGNAAVLGSFTSAQLAAALTDETGTGPTVFATSPVLVTPALGTPSSGTLTNCTFPTFNQNTTGNAATVTTNANLTGDIISTGNATSIATGVIVNADINASAAIVDTKLATIATAGKVSNSATTATDLNTASAIVARNASGNFSAGTITAALTGTASGNLVSGEALGTPSSGTLTNCTGLPISTGVSGLGTGAATFLATPSSANFAALLTDETGTGANVFATSPTLVNPALGTPSSGVLTNCTNLPVATASVAGAVSIPAAGGLALTGGGALSHSNTVAGGASTRSGITYDLQGHVVSTVAIVASDLPAATTAAKGAVIAGTGLAVDGNGILSTAVATTSDLGGIKIGSEFGLNGSNQLLLAVQANVAGGSAYPKVTVNSKGVVTAGAALDAGDIPNLDATKITSGSIDIARIAANAVTGAKVANYAVTKIGDTQPTADHIGQFFFNPLSRDLFLWDGNVFQPIGISVGEIVFAGTFDASAGGGTGHVASVTAEGTAIGLVEGSPLPAAATANNRYYLVVSESGTITSGNAPQVALAPPDIVLSTGIEWTEVDVSQTFTSVSAAQVAFTPEGTIAANNVQAAIEEVNNEKLGIAGGTMTGNLEIGTAGSLSFEGSTANAFETTIAVVDPTADRTITLPNVTGTVITTGDTGTVTSAMLLDGTVVNADINASAAIEGSKIVAATTSVVGAVQLSDSTSTTSSVLAATPTAVKAAYDLAAAALPLAGGTVTGNLEIGTAGSLTFEGATANGFETTIAVVDPTADRTATLPDATGTVALLSLAQSYTAAQRGTISALTDGATITADFAVANNFSVTLGGNRTLANPSNQTAGQSGCIWITQDGTGSRTLAYGSQWDFTGGTAPTLSTAAAAVDCLVYAVQSSTKITATLITNLS